MTVTGPSASPTASGIPPSTPCPDRDSLDVYAELEAKKEAVREYRAHARSASTRRYNHADWAQYVAWCERLRLPPEPITPRVVSWYVADLGEQVREDGTPRFKAASIRRHIASIARRHYETGGGRGLGEHEEIAETIAGISRIRREGVDRKRPLRLDDIRDLMVETGRNHQWPYAVALTRDRLAISFGFTTGMRRSEVAAVNIGDIEYVSTKGLIVRIPHSKADQEGLGASVAVPFGRSPITCVPCHWIRWLRMLAADSRSERMRLGFQTGNPDTWIHVCRQPIPQVEPKTPLFRPVTKAGAIRQRRISDASLNTLLLRRLVEIGRDPRPYGYHSLRAGFVTTARANGADPRQVRHQTRHGSDAMIDLYDRHTDPFRDNAVTYLGM